MKTILPLTAIVVAGDTTNLLDFHGVSEVVNEVQGKPSVTAKLTDGQSALIPGNFSHVVHNLDHPFRNLTVELLQDDQLRHTSFKWDEDRGLDVLTNTVFTAQKTRAPNSSARPSNSASEC